MARVSNRFTVTAIHDGSAVNAIMRCNTTLSQMVSGNTCVPDWSRDNPILWVQTDLAGSPKAPTAASIVWSYNGNAITFNDSDASVNPNKSYGTGFVDNSGNPLFEKTTRRISGIDFPALKILGNLGTADNTDNDVIACSGSVEDNGYPLNFAVSLPVRLSTLTSSGYIGQITGEQAVTTAVQSITLNAKLYNGTSQEPTFWTKWYDEGSGTAMNSGNAIAAGSNSAPSGVAQFTIGVSDITDYIVLRCDFYTVNPSTAGATPVSSAFWEVDDETDEERMYISNSATGNGASNKSGAFLRKDQSVKFTAWMGKNTSATTIDERYQHFYCRLYNNKNEVVTVNGSGTPIGTQTPMASGLFDITKSVTVPGVQGTKTGGEVEIDYAYLTEQLGGDMTGIVIASESVITET